MNCINMLMMEINSKQKTIDQTKIRMYKKYTKEVNHDLLDLSDEERKRCEQLLKTPVLPRFQIFEKH